MNWSRRWWWVAGLIVALAACSVGALADPLKSPKRLISGRTVDLAPLFAWWKKHDGERPLAAWVHATGTIVGTNSLGWTVRGVAESRADREREGEKAAGPSHDTFILENPPLMDRARFEQLVAERLRLAAAVRADQQQAGQVKAQQAQQPRTRRRNVAQARELTQEANNLKQDQTEAEAQLKIIDKQLQPYGVTPTTGQPAPQYKVDCFALDLEQAVKGVPVYNHGASFN